MFQGFPKVLEKVSSGPWRYFRSTKNVPVVLKEVHGVIVKILVVLEYVTMVLEDFPLVPERGP